MNKYKERIILRIYINLFKTIWQSRCHALSAKGWDVALRRKVFLRYGIASAATIKIEGFLLFFFVVALCHQQRKKGGVNIETNQ